MIGVTQEDLVALQIPPPARPAWRVLRRIQFVAAFGRRGGVGGLPRRGAYAQQAGRQHASAIEEQRRQGGAEECARAKDDLVDRVLDGGSVDRIGVVSS